MIDFSHWVIAAVYAIGVAIVLFRLLPEPQGRGFPAQEIAIAVFWPLFGFVLLAAIALLPPGWED